MLSKLLAVSPENALKGYPKEISIGESALYALLGYLVVFLGIALLIFVVWAIGRGMSKNKSEKVIAPKAEKPVVAQSIAVADASKNDDLDEETLAVITAALMAYYQTNNPKCEFTVKRIKRI